MKKNFSLIFFTLICKFSAGQNLIPNSNFEQFSSCPSNTSQLDTCLYWFDPLNLSGAADYYNTCATFPGVSVPYNNLGFQNAHSGVAYSGIYLSQTTGNIREYLEVPLISPLILDSCYHLEMYVNLGNDCKYTTDAIGAYFSNTIIQNVGSYAPLQFVPQVFNTTGNAFDTLTWTLVSGDYTAAGGEKYLIIGNFKNDISTNLTIINNSAPSRVYCFIDDVTLDKITSCTTGINQIEDSFFKVSPNPFTDKLNLEINNNDVSEICLIDITCRKIFEKKFMNYISVDTEQLPKGIYIYEVYNINRIIKRGKIVKY
jgi:OmpA-OmpF porin, OOP family